MIPLLIIHGLCILILLVRKKMGLLHCGPAILFLAALLPVFGILCVLSVENKARKDQPGEDLSDLNQLKIEDDIYRSIRIKPDTDSDTIVPVEESLLINHPGKRRKLLLHLLGLNPSHYVPVLRTAGQNDDTEVVHYAVTALVELRKDYNNRIFKMDRLLEEGKADKELLQEALLLDEEYLSSSLPEKEEKRERLLHADRILSELYPCADNADEAFRILEKRAYCALALGDNDQSVEMVNRMITTAPEREEGYLLKIRCFSAGKDRKGIDSVLESLRARRVFLSEKGRETVRFWQMDETLSETY